MLHRCIEMSRQRYREKGRRPDSNVLNRNDGNCSMEIVSVLFLVDWLIEGNCVWQSEVVLEKV